MLKVFNEGHANDPAPDSRAQQLSTSRGVPREELLSTLYGHFVEICQLELRLSDSNPAFNRILADRNPSMAESALAIALRSPNEPLQQLVTKYSHSVRENDPGLPLERMTARELSLIIDAAVRYSQQLRQRAFPGAPLTPCPITPPTPSLAGWSPDGEAAPKARRSASNKSAKPPSESSDVPQLAAPDADLRQKLETTALQLEKMTNSYTALESKKSALEQRLSRAQDEIRSQMTALRQQEESLTAARQMLELTRSERDRATTRSSNLADEVEQLRTKLEERDGQIEALKRMASPNDVALRNARTNVQRLAEENEMFKQSCARLGKELSQTLSELSQRDTLIESLQQQILKKATGETTRAPQVADFNDSSVPHAEPAADLTESAPPDLPAPKKKINPRRKKPLVAPTEATAEPVPNDSKLTHKVNLDPAPPAQPKIDEALGQEKNSRASLAADNQGQNLIELRVPKINIFQHLRRYGSDDGFTISGKRADPDFQPTTALPGSEEKIEVLRRRLERRQELWHPDDGREAPTATFDEKDVA